MAWVYLDDRFPDHPKVAQAGGDAAWLFVCGLAWIKRYATEGTIPRAQVSKLSDRRAPGKLARRLVDVGLWVDEGDVYRVHDYAEWNRPGEARKAAAKKAAQVRWRGHQKAPPDDADAYTNALPEDYEPPCEDDAGPDANPDASTCPLPLTPEELTFCDNSRLPSGDASSEEDAKPPPDEPPAVTDAIELLALHDLDIRLNRSDLDRVTNPASWLATARTNRRMTDGAHLVELAETDPDAGPEQLVDALGDTGEPSPWLTPGGDQFIPGIGIATGLPELPEPLPDDDFHAAASTARAALHRPGATP